MAAAQGLGKVLEVAAKVGELLEVVGDLGEVAQRSQVVGKPFEVAENALQVRRLLE